MQSIKLDTLFFFNIGQNGNVKVPAKHTNEYWEAWEHNEKSR